MDNHKQVFFSRRFQNQSYQLKLGTAEEIHMSTCRPVYCSIPKLKNFSFKETSVPSTNIYFFMPLSMRDAPIFRNS